MKQSTLFQAWSGNSASNDPSTSSDSRFWGNGTPGDPVNLFEDDDDDDDLLLAAEMHDSLGTSTSTLRQSRLLFHHQFN